MAEDNTKQEKSYRGAPEGDGLDSGDSLVKEFFTFLMENKIWWITPTVLILLLVVTFIVYTAVSGGGPIAPFIYTLF